MCYNNIDMGKLTLTGTWIEGDERLGTGSVLAEDNTDVFVSLSMKNGGWERVGPMKAYGPIVVGQRLGLIAMHGEGVNATKITEAVCDGDAYVVKTSEGLSMRLEVFGSPESESRKATRVGQIITYVRGRFGI